MTKLLALTVAAASLHGGLAQASTSLSSNPKGCVTDYDEAAGVDYFPDKAVVEFAETFSVEYFPTYKVLTIGASGADTLYVLYQCGTPEPTLNETVQLYVSVPVTTVATGTPDHIPRIELLGHRDSIVAYTGDVDQIGSPCVDALVDDGTVEQALEFDTVCQWNAVNNSALMAAEVEVAFGDSLLTPGSWCDTAVPVHNGVEILGYAEDGETIGLAQGEGIKLFSLFYNEEAKGNELFEEIESLWFCTKDNAAGCSLQLEDSPTVAWFGYTPTDPAYGNAGDGWGAPNNASYYSQAVANTGGTLLDCGDFGFDLMTDEQMLDCFADADVCVFADDYDEVELYFNATALESLTCVQNERVYDVALSGLNAWFEARQVEPHVLMEDLVVVLHGEDADFGIGSYERLLLRHVFTEESNSGSYYPDVGTCADPDAVLELQGECEVILDFTAVCDGTLTADGQDENPASTVVPGRLSSALAAAFVGAAAAAASMW